MSSIVIGCIPAHGHVTPMLSVARSFVQRGDDVRFITGSRFADKVHATGASFVPLPPDTVFDTDNGLAHFPERVKLKGAKAVAFDLEHVFARPAQGQYETVMAVLDEQSADGVLVDPAFIGASLLLGHPRSKRPAIVMCGVAPLPVSSRDTAPFGTGLPPARLLNRQRNTAL